MQNHVDEAGVGCCGRKERGRKTRDLHRLVLAEIPLWLPAELGRPRLFLIDRRRPLHTSNFPAIKVNPPIANATITRHLQVKIGFPGDEIRDWLSLPLV
jgi:hypothetical protein